MPQRLLSNAALAIRWNTVLRKAGKVEAAANVPETEQSVSR